MWLQGNRKGRPPAWSHSPVISPAADVSEGNNQPLSPERHGKERQEEPESCPEAQWAERVVESLGREVGALDLLQLCHPLSLWLVRSPLAFLCPKVLLEERKLGSALVLGPGYMLESPKEHLKDADPRVPCQKF